MGKFVGMDLHSNNSAVVISDDADRIVYQRRLPHDLAQIRAALAPYREARVGVVIEATLNWYRLVDDRWQPAASGEPCSDHPVRWTEIRRGLRGYRSSRTTSGSGAIAGRNIYPAEGVEAAPTEAQESLTSVPSVCPHAGHANSAAKRQAAAPTP
uniref:Uncharacterized protein n=1 Tax=blood disease bacterium R229 TaxID=741978 RepID=G2ZTY3_9RALS|nr:conserved hypothetical protein [blood disease bacterium R229]